MFIEWFSFSLGTRFQVSLSAFPLLCFKGENGVFGFWFLGFHSMVSQILLWVWGLAEYHDDRQSGKWLLTLWHCGNREHGRAPWERSQRPDLVNPLVRLVPPQTNHLSWSLVIHLHNWYVMQLEAQSTH